MGIYTEYLEKFSSGNFAELSAERKIQLHRISKLRGRDVLDPHIPVRRFLRENIQISFTTGDV